MKTFWIVINWADPADVPMGTKLGIGVTAYSDADALGLIKSKFHIDELPEGLSIKVLGDLRELDSRHVLPNIGNVFVRGIWFPDVGS